MFLAGMLVQAPKERFSAAWFWSGSMFLLGMAAFLGGIDHGFIEPGHLRREWIQRATWILLGLTTFCLVQTIANQFYFAGTALLIQRLSLLQLSIYSGLMFKLETFLLAVVNYAPVMLWFLVMNLLHLRTGRGNWQLVGGICLLFLASGLQMARIDTFRPIDHNSLYHLVSMPALLLLYLGGRRLCPSRPAGAPGTA